MIDALLEIGLSNALVASGLAIVAFAVTRRMRPQWALAVWLLVLAKLLIPPLWTAPLGSFRTHSVDNRSQTPTVWSLEEAPWTLPRELSEPLSEFVRAPLHNVSMVADEAELSLSELVIAGWGAGTLMWCVVAVARIRRFGSLLRHTRRVSAELQRELDQLAEQVGLQRGPELRVTHCRISPLVWAFSRRTTILLPVALIEQLTSSERRALLLHELTHLRRRDHWTKLFELSAVGLYWWLPAAWWACRQADRATEDCCDAEVVGRLPNGSRCYAVALVKTINFLSGPTQPLPFGASGFSQFRHVSRRIEMILQPQPIQRSWWRTRLALVALGTLALPVSVSSLWAEPPAKAKSENNSGTQAPTSIARSELETLWRFRASRLFAVDNLANAKAELARLEGKGDDRVQCQIKHRDALRQQSAALQSAYQAQEVTIDKLLATQRELAEAESALIRTICPKTLAGRELGLLGGFAVTSEALHGAKVAHAQACLHREQKDIAPEDEKKAEDQFNSFKQQYVQLKEELYSVSDFESESEKLRFMQDALDNHFDTMTERRVHPIKGSPTSSRTQFLDPPGDEEILQVVRGRCRDSGRTLPEKAIRIKKHPLAFYDDPPVKDYPVTGQAYISHALYRCTVAYQDASGQDHKDNLYVDHHRLRQAVLQIGKDKPADSGESTAADEKADKKVEVSTPPGGAFVEGGNGTEWNTNYDLDEAKIEEQLYDIVRKTEANVNLIRTNLKRREASLRQVEAMQAAFDAGSVSMDQLLEAQRRAADAKTSFVRTVEDLCPDSDQKHQLFAEANLMIADEALNDARRTWVKVYKKHLASKQGGEAQAEAQARDQFYQFKAQLRIMVDEYHRAQDRARKVGGSSRDDETSSNAIPILNSTGAVEQSAAFFVGSIR